METGNPATNAAARNSVAPPPGGSTEPTVMSSTREGSILERSIIPRRAPERRSCAGVSLKKPRPPFVCAVRRAQVMTMSSGCGESIFSRGDLRGEVSCDEIWARRSVADMFVYSTLTVKGLPKLVVCGAVSCELVVRRWYNG